MVDSSSLPSMENSFGSFTPRKRKALHHHQPPPPPTTSLQRQQCQTKRRRTVSTSVPNHQTSLFNGEHHKIREPKPPRQWVFSSEDYSRYKDRIVLVSYNILGVENASNHLDLYRRVSPQYLNWNRRKKLIRDELKHYKPSILCLQEVDRFSDLAELLEEDGFRGVYKARTGEAHDGCAIFWKEEKYTLLHQDDIEFRNFGLRDNVAQFCVLKMKNSHSDDVNAQLLETAPARTVVVGNIHMLFNPKRGDIKLGQIRLFIEKANTISQEWGGIPVVLAGDLNSMPQSAIYQFLASSELDILLHDKRNISGQTKNMSRWGSSRWGYANSLRMSYSKPWRYGWSKEEVQNAAGIGGATHMRHYLKLCSAYAGVPGISSNRDRCGEPLATSYHSKFLGTVDYIWHTKELIPIGVLETLPMNILRETGGLPSEKWGSDHLALVCELAFKDEIIEID